MYVRINTLKIILNLNTASLQKKPCLNSSTIVKETCNYCGLVESIVTARLIVGPARAQLGTAVLTQVTPKGVCTIICNPFFWKIDLGITLMFY